MGVIQLVEDNKALKELEVIGQGSQMRFDIDKKVFSIDQSIASAGGSASDVLQNIPSVDVDGEGNVSLRSNSSVEVWVNGKPSGLTVDNRAQVLQQMPAESIDKIEVMTNPSAKFKPDGTSGIINIVLKKNRKAGYYGSVSTGLMYVDKAQPTGTVGANINYSSSRLDAYLNLGYRSMQFRGGGATDRYSFNKLDRNDTLTVLNQVTDMKRGYGGMFGRAGLDFHLNDKHTIGLSGFGMIGTNYSESKIDYDFSNKLNPARNRSYSRDITGDGDRPSMSVSLDYKFDIDPKGSNLMASLNYSDHERDGNDNIQETENNRVNSNFTQHFIGQGKELEFKLDYTKKFTENSRFELGWNSSSMQRLSPTSSFDSLLNKDIPGYFNDFSQTEYIHAAYATYGSRYGKFSYQGGLRAEYYESTWKNTFKEDVADNGVYVDKTENGSPTYDKIKLYPSLFLSYSLPNDNELQFNITRRIDRPRGRDINPFRRYSDSTNISYGNPDLLPELSYAFELNYIKNWDNHTLSASGYYRFTDNVTQRVQYIANNTMESTVMNLSKSSNYGVEMVGKNRLFKILNLTSTLNLYYNKLDAGSYTSIYNPAVVTTIAETDMFSWNFKSMANIMLGKSTSLQLTGDYSAPRLVAQGEVSSMYSVDFGARQTFLDRNLSLSLMVRNVFNSRRRTTITSGEGFSQSSQSYFMGRMIGLTATYNFGNMKPKPSQLKKSSQQMNMDSDMD